MMPDITQGLIWVNTGLLSVIAWAGVRFVAKVDTMGTRLNRVADVLIGMATQHNMNHPKTTVNVDALIEREADK